MSIVVSNSLFSQTYTTALIITSSFLNVEPSTDFPSTVIYKSFQTYKINYQSLGNPSCGFIQLSNSKLKYFNDLGTYGDLIKCQYYFPNQVYNGPYVGNNGSWIFGAQINILGLIQMSIKMANLMGNVSITKNIAVSVNYDCQPPTVDILNKASLFYQPSFYKKNQMIVLETNLTLNCGSSLINFKKWTIFQVDPMTGNLRNQIQIMNNPTMEYSELVIQPGVLNYGLYQFAYTVTMENSIFSSQVAHYIQIVPSGIVVFSMKSGIAEITRGISQFIILNPLKYSFDVDKIITPDKLTFQFYCQSVDNGIPRGYPMASFTDKIDLMSFQNNTFPNYKMSNNKTCFDNPSK